MNLFFCVFVRPLSQKMVQVYFILKVFFSKNHTKFAFHFLKDNDRKFDTDHDAKSLMNLETSLLIKLKIKEPGRSAFSLILFKYQANIDHPVAVAQELVAENHVYGHDYILVAANIDKVLSLKNKIRFALHKIDGKGLINYY